MNKPMGREHGATTTRPSTAVMAWLRLMRVHQEINRRTAEWLRAYDLSVAQFDVIAQVGARDGLTQQELARALMVTKGNVCQLLDRMEARGLVARRALPRGRGNGIHLTEAGWRLNREIVPKQEAFIEERFSVLSDAERAELARMMRVVQRGLDIGSPQVEAGAARDEE